MLILVRFRRLSCFQIWKPRQQRSYWLNIFHYAKDVRILSYFEIFYLFPSTFSFLSPSYLYSHMPSYMYWKVLHVYWCHFKSKQFLLFSSANYSFISAAVFVENWNLHSPLIIAIIIILDGDEREVNLNILLFIGNC